MRVSCPIDKRLIVSFASVQRKIVSMFDCSAIPLYDRFLSFFKSLLLLSGDVELNPGPTSRSASNEGNHVSNNVCFTCNEEISEGSLL